MATVGALHGDHHNPQRAAARVEHGESRAGGIPDIGGVGEHCIIQERPVRVSFDGPSHAPADDSGHDLVAAGLDIFRGFVQGADVRPVGGLSGRPRAGLHELDHRLGLVQNRLVNPGIGLLELNHEGDQPGGDEPGEHHDEHGGHHPETHRVDFRAPAGRVLGSRCGGSIAREDRRNGLAIPTGSFIRGGHPVSFPASGSCFAGCRFAGTC